MMARALVIVEELLLLGAVGWTVVVISLKRSLWRSLDRSLIRSLVKPSAISE